MYVAIWIKVGAYTNSGPNHPYESPKMFSVGAQIVTALNLSLGAFSPANTCMPVYGELVSESANPRNMVVITLISMMISCIVYFSIGATGLIMFGAGVETDSLLDFNVQFLANNPWAQVPVDISKVAMSLILCFTVPLALWPCRQCLLSIATGRPSDEATFREFTIVTVSILTVVTMLAIFIPDVGIPLGVVNSLAGGSMMGIMPGLFYLGSIKHPHTRSVRAHWYAYVMIVLGILVAGIGFTLQVQEDIHKYW